MIIKYLNYEFDISKCNVDKVGVILPISNLDYINIPFEDATPEELEIINLIKEDVAKRVIVPKDPEIKSEPVDEEKVAMSEAIIDLETRLSKLEGRL